MFNNKMTSGWDRSHKRRALLTAVILLLALALAGCSSSDSDASMNDDMDMGNAETGRPVQIPNNGAVILITAPADGAAIPAGEDVIVEVNVENFTLDEVNHWHVYVDGTSFGMVMGGGTDQVLRNLEPGQHEISVSLSNADHAELEDGDSVTITVTE